MSEQILKQILEEIQSLRAGQDSLRAGQDQLNEEVQFLKEKVTHIDEKIYKMDENMNQLTADMKIVKMDIAMVKQTTLELSHQAKKDASTIQGIKKQLNEAENRLNEHERDIGIIKNVFL